MTEPSVAQPGRALPGAAWSWYHGELRDGAGVLVARVSADVIYTGDDRLLVESVKGKLSFRCRVTASDGDVFTAEQKGLTSIRIKAVCGNRLYSLTRTRPISATRRITTADGTLVAVVNPTGRGCLDIMEVADSDVLPLSDLIFVTWVCVLADAPERFLLGQSMPTAAKR